jgi:transcriptional regulator with XRE-family HTH domain
MLPHATQRMRRQKSVKSEIWLPFVSHYRTMCIAPGVEFRRMLEDLRELHAAAWHYLGEVFSYQLTLSCFGCKVWREQITEQPMTGEKFGALVRREREAREIGLREMAKMIGVSPTYLSKVERDEFGPPAEEKVKAIAKILRLDADQLLALAGRVSSDISEIIKARPVALAALLRSTKGLGPEDIARLQQAAQKAKGK